MAPQPEFFNFQPDKGPSFCKNPKKLFLVGPGLLGLPKSRGRVPGFYPVRGLFLGPGFLEDGKETLPQKLGMEPFLLSDPGEFRDLPTKGVRFFPPKKTGPFNFF